MVGPVGAAVDPRIPPSTARTRAGKIRPNGSSGSRRLSADDRATVIAPSKWESSRRSVETASGTGPARTSRRACWTARSSNGRRTPGGGSTSEMKAGEPAGSISRSSTRRAPRTGFAGRPQAASVPAGRPSSVKARAAASAAGAGSSIRASQHRLTASGGPSRGEAPGRAREGRARARCASASPNTSSRYTPSGC